VAARLALFALSSFAGSMRTCLCRTDAPAIGPPGQDVHHIRNHVHRWRWLVGFVADETDAEIEDAPGARTRTNSSSTWFREFCEFCVDRRDRVRGAISQTPPAQQRSAGSGCRGRTLPPPPTAE